MAFLLPVFNLTANVWRPPAVPPAAPTFQYDAQLYFPSRGMLDVQPGQNQLWQPPIYLRVPLGSDVQVNDRVECGAGDGWFYKVRFVERTHRGFPNEYLSCIIEQISSSPPPPVGGFIELESGAGVVLLESADKVLLE